ncbi:MAG TPA: SRPBCC domain-containing protein [Gammaproteobacteria bacterium]|nr:SRPBCC domain-containing protein [Gammaproteobacteria bacterium]
MSAVPRYTPGDSEREIELVRVYDAPRELVFRAWTDPAQLARWWGPEHFTNPVCEVDARVGGELRIVMRAPDGNDYPMRGVFQEVVRPERLVFTNIAVDAEDRPIIEGLTTVTFAEQGGKTKLTLRTRGTAVKPVAIQYLQGMEMGWSQSLTKLATLLPQL